MIGLGVAIDYSLFIVMRFRQELAKGRTPREAATVAGSTAGRAVVFAGATVAISISGLALVGIPFVAKMGYGTAIAVIVAVITAVTLHAGPAVEGRPPASTACGCRGRARAREPRPDRGISRVARIVERRPKTVLVATLAVVLTMAIPVLSLNMGTADAGTNPPDTTTRKAYDLLAEGFGPGFNGPLLVAVDQGDDPQATQDAGRGLRRDRRRRRRGPAHRQRGRATPPRSPSSPRPRRSRRRPPTWCTPCATT